VLRLVTTIAVGVGLAASGCAGSSPPAHATLMGGCNGVKKTGATAPATGFTPTQVCEAAGSPQTITRRGVLVVWHYPAGGTVSFVSGKGILSSGVAGVPAGGGAPDVGGMT